MFHGKHFSDQVGRPAEYAGLHLSAEQLEQLGVFADWLAVEAVNAGGIGPEEGRRIVDRHIADALVFAAAWQTVPDTLLDVGSGVGLPGIPLAIALPETQVTLLDRSGERCRLARRATRVVELTNVAVVQGDVITADGFWDVVTFRASLPPERAFSTALPLVNSGGCVIVAASRMTRPTDVPLSPPGTSVDIVEIGPGVLDSPAWLLRMTVTQPRK